MNLTFAVAAIMISIGTVLGYQQLEMVKMRIIENGKELDEKIYVDKNDNYEIVNVPAHGDLSALLLVKDFKRKQSIYKVADDKTCYVVPLDANDEKPTQLKKSVEKVHGNFPSATVTVQQRTFLNGGPLDLTTDIGKMAKKFCGDYEVVKANYLRGDVDLNKFAEEEKQRISTRQGRVKRQTTIPMQPEYVCPGHQDEAETAMTQCIFQLSNIQVNCKFQGKTCTYTVNCEFNSDQTAAECDSEHTRSAAICCEYTCP